MRMIFMGTPEFAVPSLRALAALPGWEVVGVVTRQDKPAGRGSAPQPPPVKVAALALGLPVLQPGSLRKPAAQQQLAALAPDLIVVAAFGQILPPAVLDLPPYGCLNVHASLLPRHRGASPIATAILEGDEETGNTIMLMDAGLDTGGWIAQFAFAIAPDDTTATLTKRLAEQGARLIAQVVPGWIAGHYAPAPQPEADATMTRLIRKEDGIIDWRHDAAMIDRQIRAYTPWPGTQTTWQGKPLKILAAHPLAETDHALSDLDVTLPPGTVIAWGRGAEQRLAVICGEQSLLVLDMVQLPGKRAGAAADIARGQPALIGAVFS
jgi:methionyl-tRNA formyltransferase